MSTDALAGRPDRARFRVIVPLPAPRPAFEPSPSRTTLDIVIPVCNEEEDLARSVRRLHAFLRDQFPFSARITIADYAGTDGTRALAGRLAAELPEVRLLHVSEKGRGRSVAVAWLTSEAKVVAYMDIELSYDLTQPAN
jgi:hypothetical protein